MLHCALLRFLVSSYAAHAEPQSAACAVMCFFVPPCAPMCVRTLHMLSRSLLHWASLCLFVSSPSLLCAVGRSYAVLCCAVVPFPMLPCAKSQSCFLCSCAAHARFQSAAMCLPGSQAADALRVLGIGRNEYISILNQCKGRRLLWRVNRCGQLLLEPLVPVHVSVGSCFLGIGGSA